MASLVCFCWLSTFPLFFLSLWLSLSAFVYLSLCLWLSLCLSLSVFVCFCLSLSVSLSVSPLVFSPLLHIQSSFLQQFLVSLHRLSQQPCSHLCSHPSFHPLRSAFSSTVHPSVWQKPRFMVGGVTIITQLFKQAFCAKSMICYSNLVLTWFWYSLCIIDTGGKEPINYNTDLYLCSGCQLCDSIHADCRIIFEHKIIVRYSHQLLTLAI